ncbi:acetamidase/formamidase family protein [Sediminicoccus rosea]|jgi:acetamidase/formamidase|uniref:Acetamidase/formamidase family protein n=1 Tax=Sediminicoccus rosea TaxID=1225128 RepID=A0ABZ0PKA5_9PROT|nr:acetamidase/formamidase family protein [Sediminicoccus rosea]WPB85797.1 acetamidase/formamidase family protein [Sediminicoccus rosea]
MARHIFRPTRYHNTLGTAEPCLRIADGDTLVAETVDASGLDANEVAVAARPNPMTGPFFVEGAEPGDTLAVEIIRLTPNRRTGWTYSPLALTVLDPAAILDRPKQERAIWEINANEGTVRLRDAPAALAGFTPPLAPMIGCFGVAPAGGEAISTATSGAHGGNMDYRRFAPGTTAWFPVSVPGALFYLGDGHAAQGDGEITGTGIETSFEMEVRLSVLKRRITWPRAETAEEIITIGNARPLDQALQHATTEMQRWLGEDYGLDARAASHLMGMVVRYDVGNVFNPAYTVACRVAKKWLTKA